MDAEVDHELKIKLSRIVSMLTRMALKFGNISEPELRYSLSPESESESESESEHEHEHEHEHEYEYEIHLNGSKH
jgi:ABC-type Zn2+ transport system substrate-binding protein/surface adhesin